MHHYVSVSLLSDIWLHLSDPRLLKSATTQLSAGFSSSAAAFAALQVTRVLKKTLGLQRIFASALHSGCERARIPEYQPQWQREAERWGSVCAGLIRWMRRLEVLQAQILDVFCQGWAGNCFRPHIFDWYHGTDNYSFIQKPISSVDTMVRSRRVSAIPLWATHSTALWFGSQFPVPTINILYGSFQAELQSQTAVLLQFG